MLVSMDVTSLYTNIPHNEGIDACREVWNSRLTQEPPTKHLVDLLTLVLECNNFEFNGRHYLQICGTAMGTRVAPSYANIFTGRIERQLLDLTTIKPLSWFRFIDDIDMKWCHGRESLDAFLALANSFHPSIKFTSEVSNDNHVFLDTTSRIVNNKQEIDLYTKPTDTHQYLLPTSCHPKHVCRNIPFSLALRIRRICTSDQAFEARARQLATQLCDRGYKRSSVYSAIDRAGRVDRQEMLTYRSKPEAASVKVPFVTTYNPNLPPIRSVIDSHWHVIESSPKLSRIFPCKPVLSFRRPKSLRDLLVHARLRPSENDRRSGESKPCGQRRCKTCPLMPIAPSLVQRTTGATVLIRCVATCKTSNVVYVITSKRCGKQYVGETKQSLNLRMNLHRSDWRLSMFERSPVALHFRENQHTFEDVSVHCIDHDPMWTDDLCQRRETYWIRRLNTVEPHGINRSDGGSH